MEKKKNNEDGKNDPSLGVLFNELIDLKNEVSSLKERVAGLEAKIQMIMNQNQQLGLILKYVVTPLIIILGALIGLKLTLP